MNKNWVFGAALVLVVLAIGGWFLLSSNKPLPQAPVQEVVSEPQAQTSTPEADLQEVLEIVVDGDEYSFSPPKLTLQKGQKVRLVFNNKGSLPHNLTIDKLNLATKTVGREQSDTLEFTPDQEGVFEIYCSIGNHKASGMVGEVSVE